MIGKEKLDALKAEHKCQLYVFDVGEVDEPVGTVVFRKPPGAAFEAFLSKAMGDEFKMKATQLTRSFVLNYIVFSEPLEPAELFEEYAGIAPQIFGEMSRLHQARRLEHAKKA